MSTPLRVCFVINSLSYGGAENLLVDLVRESEEVDFEVVHFGGDESLRSQLESAGAEVHSLGESFRFDPRAAIRLVRILQNREFDAVHLHLPYSQTVGRLAARSAGDTAIVSTQHNIPSRYHVITRLGERFTRPLDDATVAVSRGVERAFTGTAHEPNKPQDGWSTIYNGIDIEGFRQAVDSAETDSIRDQYNIDADEHVFLSVGRYAPVKAQKDLIRGFTDAELPNSKLLIVGHGPLEEDLRAAVREHGTEDTVHVTGRVERVEPYYKLADVFVSSSSAEGMPVVLIEAMAASLPIVATDIPGVREVVVEEETGYLYPAGDTETLSNYFEELASKKDLTELGESGYERAQNLFDVEQMADSYVQLYHTID